MLRKLQLTVILFLFSYTTVVAQGVLSGKITDANTGDPLPGANIILQNTQKGASSDIDGNYVIRNIEPGTYTVMVRFISFSPVTQEITISQGNNTLNISLSKDYIGLDEVVVTGVGTETSKKKLGINVSSVSEEAIQKVPAYDITSALTGKIAGSSVVSTGAPGGGNVITLRGINTLGNSRPMIIVDGVQIDASVSSSSGGDDVVDRLSDLDLSQIERVEVVKGAAAATLYGAQGANGVIQIFTKSGQPGDVRVSLNSSISFDVLNENNIPEQPTDFHNFPVDDNGNVIGIDFDEVNGVWTVPNEVNNGVWNKPYTGWVDPQTGEINPFSVQDNRVQDYYGTAATERYGLTVSGGNDRTTYLVSGSFLNQEGIEPETGFDRVSLRVNTDTDITNNLKFGLRTAFSNSERIGASESGNNIESGLSNILLTKPFVDVFANNSRGVPAPKFQAGSVSTNPFFQKFLTDFSDETNRFIGSANLNYRPTRFVELDYKIGVDWWLRRLSRIQTSATGFEDPNTTEEEVVILNDDGFVNKLDDTNWQFNSIASAFIRTDFEDDFNINIPVQTTTQLTFDWRRRDFTSINASGDGLPFGLPLETIPSAGTKDADEFQLTFVTFGFLVNQKFDFDEFGGFSLGARADKSSAFGEAADFEVFPRADAYFRVSDFDFWDGLRNTVNEFKIRGAYGEAGIQPGAFDRFVTLSNDAIGSGGVFNASAVLSNPQLEVEESQEFELGTDLGFKLGKNLFQSLGVSVTYWTRETTGSIEQLQVAPSNGATQILSNAIDLSSDGFDVSIDALTFFNQNWNWRTSIQFGTSETQVDRISNGEDLIFTPTASFDYLFREGENFGLFFGFNPVTSFDEVDANGERIIDEADVDNFTMVDGVVVNRFTKEIQFRNEKEIIGDPTPDFTLSFRNDFSIKKNLNIAFQLDWVQGGDIFNATKWWMFQRNNHTEFQDAVLIDGGEEVGSPMFDSNGNPTSQISRVDGSQPQAWDSFHESKIQDATPFFVEDGSHLKLRELSVSYDFADLVGFDGIRRLQLGVQGRNLFTITGYDGFDPEVSGEDIDTRFRGLDIFTFPNYRNFTFTARVDF